MYFYGGYALFKKVFLLFHTALLKFFIYNKVDILDFPWNNSCRELGQGDFYSLDQEKVPFLCNCKKNHAYLNLVYNICHKVDIYRLVQLLTSSFCYYF